MATHARLLAVLTGKPCTTPELRELGFLAPAARVCELRQQGHEIVTRMVFTFAEDGKPHRVAQYHFYPDMEQGSLFN